MTARRVAYLLTLVLVGYFALLGWRGWQLLTVGRAPFVLLGVGVLLLPVVGAWLVWQELRFGRATERLAGELAAESGSPPDRLAAENGLASDERPAENGLPPDERPAENGLPPDERRAENGPAPDELPRTRGGRVDRRLADAVFERRRAEVERSPRDWRAWYRLAAAYGDAGDTRRGRRAMRHAITLYEEQRRTGRPSPHDHGNFTDDSSQDVP